MELDYCQLLEKEWRDQHDPSHDVAHVKRVVRMARYIAQEEDADLSVVLPAAWLHDLVNLKKDHPQRQKASELSADRACLLLKNEGIDNVALLENIHHVIMAHSFSAGVQPQTLEAKVVQDADRLDSLGCLGMMRTFAVSGQLGRALFNPEDPFARQRELDDRLFSLDHFNVKLFPIGKMLHTETARALAAPRLKSINDFLSALELELHTPPLQTSA